jgi:hypothetical protein
MDCEQSEWEMLDAAHAAVTGFSIVVAEMHCDPDRNRSIEDFAAVLTQHGFTTLSGDGLYVGRR